METVGKSAEIGRKDGEFLKRYQKIVEMPLSPENVDSYADVAMDQLGELIADIQERYKWEGLELSDREREDKIFEDVLHGKSIEVTLDRIDEVAQRLELFDDVIQRVRSNPNEGVILPPDEVEEREMVGGNGDDVRESRILPKLKTELFVLEQDFGVDVQDPEQLKLSTGILGPNMQRRMSYDAVELPELARLILSCDAGGNRTYIFDMARLEELKITPEMIKNGTKSQLNELLTAKPDIGKSIIYSANYVERIRSAIENPASELVAEKDKAEKAEYLKVVERAPEGWMVMKAVADECGIGETTLTRYYSSHSEDIGELTEFINRRGRRSKYFSPEQIEKLKAHFGEKKEIVPEGWMALGTLADNIGTTDKTLLKYYYKHIDEIGPLTEYASVQGKVFSYFSPEQIEKMKEYFEGSKDIAPVGWMTMNGLATELEMSFDRVRKVYDKHKEEIGALREYFNTRKQQSSYFSPEQIGKMRQYLEDVGETVPEGWITVGGLARELDVSHSAVRKYCSEHVDEIGAPREYYSEDNKQPFSYFSPEQADMIRKYFSGQETGKAPEGWMTVKDLMKKFGASRGYIEKYYEENAEEIGALTEYVGDKISKRYKYFSPEQVSKMEQHFNNRGEVVPDGWVTMYGLKDELGVGYGTVKKIYEDHVDEIGAPKEYMNAGGRKLMFFSPEQAEKIRRYVSWKKLGRRILNGAKMGGVEYGEV